MTYIIITLLNTHYVLSFLMSQGDPTYQTPEKLQNLPQDNVLTTSAYTELLTDQVSNFTYYIKQYMCL